MSRRSSSFAAIFCVSACIAITSLVSATRAHAVLPCTAVSTGLPSYGVAYDGKAHFKWGGIGDFYRAYLSGPTLAGVVLNEVRDLGDTRTFETPFILNGTPVRSLTVRIAIACQNPGSAPSESPASIPFFVSNPDFSRPGRPLAVHASRAGRDVLVTWSAPNSESGSLPSNYLVTVRPGGATCTSNGALQCSFKNLKAGSTYTFAVQAKTAVGLGPAVSVQFRLPAPKPSQGLS
jgi:hypothetical protein